MSPYDASPDELRAAGWGDHLRRAIPQDWQTRRGPDQITGFLAKPISKPYKARAPRKQSARRIPWREQRAKWLIENGRHDQFAQEFGACMSVQKTTESTI